jgi:hypothetical protein
MRVGELAEVTAGELHDVSSGELSTSSDLLSQEYGDEDFMHTVRWYSPDRDDPKRRDLNHREPMDRRAIRYVVRCLVCETLHDVTHGEAHASGGEIRCDVCDTLLPPADVLHATKGRMNPKDIP